MNYGYDRTPHDKELGEALQEYLDTLPADDRGLKPYIEIDGLYKGVRIHRLTHYSNAELEKIVVECDAIHKRITEK